ncbi:hypothetical protein [Halomarina pelagica]|uniref:hypothetical protein n=1 Tax=Halomarina pelagica TaxID=2961599 RepID=UPI0020C309D8|nr:hypothetical protein [Halomarina sp. BND7]
MSSSAREGTDRTALRLAELNGVRRVVSTIGYAHIVVYERPGGERTLPPAQRVALREALAGTPYDIDSYHVAEGEHLPASVASYCADDELAVAIRVRPSA